MPARQFIHGIAETLINKVLSLDEGSVQRLRPMAGKQLKVTLTDINQQFTLAFSDRVDVLDSDNEPDCHIQVAVSVLPQLQDSSQLTQLIREQKLNVIGDMHLAQQVSDLFKQLDIDWQEHLSRYTGDVLAYKTARLFGSGKQHLSQQWQQFRQQTRDAVVEEKRLAVPTLALLHFSQQVDDLAQGTEKLAERVQALIDKQELS